MTMKKLYTGALFAAVMTIAASCGREKLPATETTVTPVVSDGSFSEEFTNAGDLTSKGWVFRNNSNPIGVSGWRQGRYEAGNAVQYKFLAPVPYLGFPAYSASKTPNDFISCDLSAASDAATGTSNYSAWLISPAVPMRNGSKLTFYTRSADDSQYPVYCKDRMQIRFNLTDGSANVGTSETSVGMFTTLASDINSGYVYNDPSSGSGGGYPEVWTQVTITLSGLPPAGIDKGRFAFRYFAEDAGYFGGSSGDNFPTVVGIDQLVYTY